MLHVLYMCSVHVHVRRCYLWSCICVIIIATPTGGACVVEADENCMKFLKRTLPCSFDKVNLFVTSTCIYMYM